MDSREGNEYCIHAQPRKRVWDTLKKALKEYKKINAKIVKVNQKAFSAYVYSKLKIRIDNADLKRVKYKKTMWKYRGPWYFCFRGGISYEGTLVRLATGHESSTNQFKSAVASFK